mmetsp:Transcript_7263/g.19468  ORF Transcript_7263/g.19468 Transcript_7263/m.19468 type:complete len:222 (+) Transcript_7263:1823-2488(+)
MSLSIARTNALLPTFAAPTTYTSRPLRSAHTLDVAALTPSPVRLDTKWQLMTLSFFRTAASISHSATSRGCALPGRRSILVPTRMMGLGPTMSRTLPMSVPEASVRSTTMTTTAFLLRTSMSCCRSCSGVTSALPSSSMASSCWSRCGCCCCCCCCSCCCCSCTRVHKSCTPGIMAPLDSSEQRSHRTWLSCRCIFLSSYFSGAKWPAPLGSVHCRTEPQP